jgi:CheY-like chemotaxis protein
MAYTILVTDDDEDDYYLLTDTFISLQLDYHFKQLKDGKELINYLSEIQKNLERLPDMIILDYNMPKMNGLETLKKLRTFPEFKHIPVIIYSTSNNQQLKHILLNNGANGCVSKNSSLQKTAEFVLALDAYLNGHGELPGKLTKASIPHT